MLLKQAINDFSRAIFWDVDLEKVDINIHKEWIIERVLKYGRPEHIIWLLENYSEKAIIDVIKSSKELDRKTVNYWSIHFKFSKEETLCFKRQFLRNSFYC